MSALFDLGQAGWPGLCAVACGLGMRHALDADHVSAIDGIARRNLARRPTSAWAGGALFSAGHCLLVALGAVAAVRFADAWRTPLWLETAGALVTVFALLLLGSLNLVAAWRPSEEDGLPLVGWRARLFAGGSGDHPLAVLGVGALFALSFDSMSLAAAFGFAGGGQSGAAGALALAGWFAIGMIAVGGANGLWIVALLRAAAGARRRAARLFTGAIGVVNIAVGLLALAGLLAPGVGRWSEGNGLLVTGAMIAGLALAFALALLSRRRLVPIRR